MNKKNVAFNNKVERALAFLDIFGVVCYATKAVFIGVLLIIFFINYQMFVTAKAARRGKEDGKGGVKNISTCMLAVACFVLFSSLLMVFCGLQFVPNVFSRENAMLFTLWANTIACTNSTINCFIFFWKDKSLCVEGKKLLKCFKVAKIHPWEVHSCRKNCDNIFWPMWLSECYVQVYTFAKVI